MQFPGLLAINIVVTTRNEAVSKRLKSKVRNLKKPKEKDWSLHLNSMLLCVLFGKNGSQRRREIIFPAKGKRGEEDLELIIIGYERIGPFKSLF